MTVPSMRTVAATSRPATTTSRLLPAQEHPCRNPWLQNCERHAPRLCSPRVARHEQAGVCRSQTDSIRSQVPWPRAGNAVSVTPLSKTRRTIEFRSRRTIPVGRGGTGQVLSALAPLPSGTPPVEVGHFVRIRLPLSPSPACPAVSPVVLLGQIVLIGVQTFDFLRPFTVQDKLSEALTRPD